MKNKKLYVSIYISYLLIFSCFTGFCSAVDSIEERAIKLELPITSKQDLPETFEISVQSFKKMQEAKYDIALEIILAGLEQFPNSFRLQGDLASLLGDHSENFSGILKEQMEKKAKELFNKLLHEIEGQPKDIVYPFKNEYYYRFAMYKNQYELGLARVADYWGTKG